MGQPKLRRGALASSGSSRRITTEYRGELVKSYEWLESIQKKRLIYGLLDRQLILAFDAAVGSVSKFIEQIYRESLGKSRRKARGKLCW